MSYQANLDIVIALDKLQISSFKKQGTIRFKITLFTTHKKEHQDQYSKTLTHSSLCSPYNIYKLHNEPVPVPKEPIRPQSMASNLSITPRRHQKPTQRYDSYIDDDQQSYFSRIFESQLQSQTHTIEESCYFRKYLNVKQIDQTNLLLRIDLYFKPQGEHSYVEAGYYEGLIHKLSGICTFLPASFDEFGSFRITGTYQATILQYRFGSQESKIGEYQSFDQYLNAATNGFRAQKLVDFFNYYHSSLETQLTHIQEHHLDLLKIIAPNQLYPYTTVNSNQVIYSIASHIQTIQHGNRPHFISITPNYDDLKERATHQISKDFASMKALIYQKWNDFILCLSNHLHEATNHYHTIYREHQVQRLRTHAFSHQIEKNWDWTTCRYQDSGKTYLQQAKMDKKKNKQEELWRDHFPIQSKNFFQEECKNIKIFQQIYQVGGMLLTKRSMSPMEFNKNGIAKRYTSQGPERTFSPRVTMNSGVHIEHFAKKGGFGQISPPSQVPTTPQKVPMLPLQKLSHFEAPKNKKQKHIVIFVHGYQASRQDFILFKNCLQIRYNCRVFISSTNEGRTDDHIQILGKRLAIQLNNFFKTVQFGPSTRISFVGHSMGGIIIRSALSYIKNLDNYLYSYMSFSSPHLGYLYQPSALVQAGLWLLNAWQKVQSLDDLCMRDNNGDIRKSVLYRLSQNNSLKGFKKLALISSTQDEYVPYQSARIQKNSSLLSKLSYPNPPIIREMVDNILGDINSSQLSRINVIFNIDEKSFDSWVGRTAHVKYLSDQKFIKMFCLIFEKFFI